MNKDSYNNTIKDRYANYYLNIQDEWREICAKDKVDNIITLCSHLGAKSVIEVGSGDGAVIAELHNQNFSNEYYALDVSSSGVDKTSSRDLSNLIDVKIFDGYVIPYEDKQFDLAILTHVLEHVEHPRLLISEISRVAKYVYIEVPLEDNIRLKRGYVNAPVGHINYYNERTLYMLLVSCGLVVTDEKVTNPSLDVHLFNAGNIVRKMLGGAQWVIKNVFLKLFKSLGMQLFTYHMSVLVCAKKN